MSEANEPTAKSPTAPKQDRMAAARAAKKNQKDDIAELRAQIAALSERLSEKTAPIGADAPSGEPGEYFVAGTDTQTGKPVYRKRKWTKGDVEKKYPSVTFAPTLSTPIRPHGVTYVLEAGKIATVPSIVKDIHDQMVLAIRRQSEGYRVSAEQTSAIFEAAKNDTGKGRHFEGLKHIGYGWPLEALEAVARGLGDDAAEMERIGWEPEVGFPGGFGGKPLPESK